MIKIIFFLYLIFIILNCQHNSFFIKMKIAFNNLYTHFVFITCEKNPYITERIKEPLENHITKVINHNICKMCAIYANPEHVHFLVSRSPLLAEETIATIVAFASSKFINNKRFCNGTFSWHHTASAFSVSKTEVDEVRRFILFQPEYHRQQTFEEEYNDFFLHYQKNINLDF